MNSNVTPSRGNDNDDRPPQTHHHQQQQQHQGGYGGHRQNGYNDNFAYHDKHDHHHQPYGETSRGRMDQQHTDGSGRGRHAGGGRNKNPPRSASPSSSNRDVSQPRRFHDDSNRSSVDRSVVGFNDRLSPSTGKAQNCSITENPLP